MITATILLLIAAVLALSACLIVTFFKLSDAKRELSCAHNLTNARNDEITHLRKVQAQKIDRALFMLVSVRAKRLTDQGKPSVVRCHIDLSDVMHAALSDQSELAIKELRELLAQHIARRVANLSPNT